VFVKGWCLDRASGAPLIIFEFPAKLFWLHLTFVRRLEILGPALLSLLLLYTTYTEYTYPSPRADPSIYGKMGPRPI
jgi:hypothetical protein